MSSFLIACNESFIPFSAIHKLPVKFKSFRREVFMQHVEIGVTIVDYERNLTTHLLNPNLYVDLFLKFINIYLLIVLNVLNLSLQLHNIIYTWFILMASEETI